jgi:hypothetical protein
MRFRAFQKKVGGVLGGIKKFGDGGREVRWGEGAPRADKGPGGWVGTREFPLA